jgi:hypothetical protein
MITEQFCSPLTVGSWRHLLTSDGLVLPFTVRERCRIGSIDDRCVRCGCFKGHMVKAELMTRVYCKVPLWGHDACSFIGEHRSLGVGQSPDAHAPRIVLTCGR